MDRCDTTRYTPDSTDFILMVPSFKVAPTKAVFSSIVHCPIVPLLVTTASEVYDTSSFWLLGTVLEVSKKAPYTPPILPGGNNKD